MGGNQHRIWDIFPATTFGQTWDSNYCLQMSILVILHYRSALYYQVTHYSSIAIVVLVCATIILSAEEVEENVSGQLIKWS